jgi:hypothetical protein
VRYGKIPREFRGATLADDFVAFFANSLERVSESATTKHYPRLQLYGATQQHIKSINQEVREAVRYKMSHDERVLRGPDEEVFLEVVD